jgi:hypothetical protein
LQQKEILVMATSDYMNSLSDEDFNAWWDVRIEEAAQDGNETEVERLMVAYGEAFEARFPR